MMGVYIKGMEMPEGALGAVPVIIFADGVVRHYFSHLKLGDAIPVPPHGRLIDADALANSITGAIYHSDLRDAPTVIPAEEGET